MPGQPSSFVQQAVGLVQAGRAQDALAVLNHGAEAGDAESLFTLGMLSVTGQLVRRDLQLAKGLFARASAAGHAEAAHCHVAFVTHGAGGTPDWQGGLTLLERLAARDEIARRQLEIIRRMDLTARGDPASLPQPRQLSTSPDIRIFPGLFTPEECEFLVEAATPHLQPALVGDRTTGVEQRVVDRTCETAGFPLIFEDPATHALNRRLAAASETAPEQGEPLQVLRYSPGEEYRPHYDLATGPNPRCQTFLVYLNDGYEGGETAFLKAEVSFKGGIGDGILFRNATQDGTPDYDTLHAGQPVLSGIKLIASRWIRAHPIDYYKPLI